LLAATTSQYISTEERPDRKEFLDACGSIYDEMISEMPVEGDRMTRIHLNIAIIATTALTMVPFRWLLMPELFYR
jgi:hypothetical protein